ncbi:hypothetical protein JR316_0009847 [Psilocybe cubensis]|uniref:Uncharacterized protein n=2 Tax=Psilocybe cubensis TaxID=181762 RepID=A0ACB8GPN9_PSICU|nr:hypothetical protein JR316_0009847 [Psilocybe cubensis]KAH9477621.1 hypothetical protein JR316_0009847 [Psilocybe cubensis]
MKCNLSAFTFCLMFIHFATSAPLPDSIDYEKPSALLPRTSFGGGSVVPSSSTRRSRKHDEVQGRYDVYHLRDLEDPVFVSAFQLPTREGTSIERTPDLDDASVSEEQVCFNQIRASTDRTTWDIMTLAQKQATKLEGNL